MQHNSYQEKIIITDVTRMGGKRVCVAGINKDLKSIRPVTYPGVEEKHLFDSKNKLIIFPGAVVNFNFLKDPITIRKPHTEDISFEPTQTSFEKHLSQESFFEWLNKSKYESLDNLFDGEVEENAYVKEGNGSRSIGTILPKDVSFHIDTYDKPKPKLRFVDGSNNNYDITITDLRIKQLIEKNQLQSYSFNNILKNATSIILRVGLARGFNPENQWEYKRCYLQITGLYTLPDYNLPILKELL